MSKMNETAAARYVGPHDLYQAYLTQGRIERSKAVRAMFGAMARWVTGAVPTATSLPAKDARAT